MIQTGQIVKSRCPTCKTVLERRAYDIGSGPELSCANCEWCWGANGQPLRPLDVAAIRVDIGQGRSDPLPARPNDD